MAKRHGMSKAGSGRHFSKHAARTHVKNTNSGGRTVMRGGIRL